MGGPIEERDAVVAAEAVAEACGAPRPRPALARYFPAMYATIYPVVADVAREYGYAIAIHGSLARDLDLIAVPWTVDARPPGDLIQAISERVRSVDPDAAAAALDGPPMQKPHGRLAWALPLRIGAFLDISVMLLGERQPPLIYRWRMGEDDGPGGFTTDPEELPVNAVCERWDGEDWQPFAAWTEHFHREG